MFAEYVLSLNSDINDAIEDTSPDLYRRVLVDMSSNENKSSAVELQQSIEMYE